VRPQGPPRAPSRPKGSLTWRGGGRERRGQDTDGLSGFTEQGRSPKIARSIDDTAIDGRRPLSSRSFSKVDVLKVNNSCRRTQEDTVDTSTHGRVSTRYDTVDSSRQVSTVADKSKLPRYRLDPLGRGSTLPSASCDCCDSDLRSTKVRGFSHMRPTSNRSKICGGRGGARHSHFFRSGPASASNSNSRTL